MHMRTVLVHHLVVQASEPLPERDDGERGHAADSDADGKDMSDEDFDLPGDLLSSDEDLDEDPPRLFQSADAPADLEVQARAEELKKLLHDHDNRPQSRAISLQSPRGFF